MPYLWTTEADARVNARCAELRANKTARAQEVAQARTPVDPDTFRWSEILFGMVGRAAAWILFTAVVFGFLYWAAGHIG